jgi:aldose 1-epimerase
MPYAGQRIATDNILIPTGDIQSNQQGSLNDFWSTPKQIGANFSNPDLLGNCGFNCTGYDTCYLTNRAASGPFDWRAGETPVARLRSAWSGIQLDIFTDQDAFQVYSCGGQNGSMALKSTQGLHDNADRPRTIQQYGCLVLEVEDWIDAINQPEWGRNKKQIFGPGDDPYVLQASYRFSLNDTAVGLLGPGSG